MVMMEMGNTLEQRDNKKILIVGNGFDLAHNLKSRYNDVLVVFKNWESFYGSYKNRKTDTELVPVLDIFDFILSADINFVDRSIIFERNIFFKFENFYTRYFTILNNKIFIKIDSNTD